MMVFSLAIIGKQRATNKPASGYKFEIAPKWIKVLFLCQLCGDRSLGVFVREAQAAFPFLGTWKLCTPLGQGGEGTWLCSLEPKKGQQVPRTAYC